MSEASMKSLLTRVLEPEVMDASDEARDYNAMDHGAVNRLFVADFLAAWKRAELDSSEILDLGVGTAQIPIALCQAASGIQVVGVDLAQSMLKVASRNVTACGLENRIQLQ